MIHQKSDFFHEAKEEGYNNIDDFTSCISNLSLEINRNKKDVFEAEQILSVNQPSYQIRKDKEPKLKRKRGRYEKDYKNYRLSRQLNTIL